MDASRTSRRKRRAVDRRRSTTCSTAIASCATIERALAPASGARRRARSRELHHRFEAIGGYGARARAATLLAGLGFAEARQTQPVASFSGGWRMRLNLAQALMCRSDLLLLDEPTNHLDLDAVLWLEDWLRRYPGTLLLITHDRDFLDAVVDTIVHIDNGKLTTLHAATTRSSSASARSSSRCSRRRTRSSSGRSRICSAFVDRFRAKATKAQAGAKPDQGARAAILPAASACACTASASSSTQRRSAASDPRSVRPITVRARSGPASIASHRRIGATAAGEQPLVRPQVRHDEQRRPLQPVRRAAGRAGRRGRSAATPAAPG